MVKKETNLKPQKSNSANKFLKFTGLGFSMMVSIGMLGYLGFLLDNYLNVSPLFILLFVIGGLIGDIYLVLKSTSDD